MQKPKNPCDRECPERTPTCHADCPKYVAYEIMCEAWRGFLAAEKRRENDFFATSRHNPRKKKRHKPYRD